jgi:hypothetical protein
MHLCSYEAKLTNLKLKTHSNQILGSLLLDIVLPGLAKKPVDLKQKKFYVICPRDRFDNTSFSS